MPLFQKQPEHPADTAPDRAALLAELLGNVGATTAAAPAPKARRKAVGTYEAVMYKAAVLVGLVIAVAIWYAGASFTVQWFGSAFGIERPGLEAWLLPIAVTALEIGCVLGRRRVPWLWLFWFLVLAFDAYTTAAGLMEVAEGRVIFNHQFAVANTSDWIILSVIGLIFALAPEPAARSFWRELWS